MTIGFGPDPVAQEVARHIEALQGGRRLAEREHVDYKVTGAAARHLTEAYADHRRERPVPTRSAIALRYARARGRISTTELGALVEASPSNVGTILKELESDGLLTPSSHSRIGRGFHYRWVGGDDEER
ncbi:winged helix-turn-helix domain-containing protein [Propioniciclava sp. MC1595]|uniref:winged helix-turn-helix domain-containing protein n=1 Tax=Propioniciclava sp. MC1595 TaxID=2760308 RepID=UPI00166278B7|nr:winged helix-turn-helix domain-containing protein [Propioniciclava sp. MC1595]MBB1494939.1 winged helix-turn-helix domain-containing protein [Propioniciclava sp. MC1595]QTE25559.1 winged helix-turn-helix domain-containing protein [Propioniciclava sp. MC1595]